jgi:hypothetical protein
MNMLADHPKFDIYIIKVYFWICYNPENNKLLIRSLQNSYGRRANFPKYYSRKFN